VYVRLFSKKHARGEQRDDHEPAQHQTRRTNMKVEQERGCGREEDDLERVLKHFGRSGMLKNRKKWQEMVGEAAPMFR